MTELSILIIAGQFNGTLFELGSKPLLTAKIAPALATLAGTELDEILP